MRQAGGTLAARDRGTPQGSAVSPVLANLYLHYAFDMWLAREHPGVAFERYCDDAVIHCSSQEQAVMVRDALAAQVGEALRELPPGGQQGRGQGDEPGNTVLAHRPAQ